MRASTFVSSVAPLFESEPGFLYRLAAARPFGAWLALFQRGRSIAHDLPEPLRVDLVDAHPRIGARREGLSAMSAGEQGPPSATSDAVSAALTRLNEAYESRFGFRYCVFVAGRPLAALVPGFEAALEADRESELHRGLDAVVDIAMARHAAASPR